MIYQIGKLEQAKLLLSDDRTLSYFPNTIVYSKENMREFLDRYKVVFIKHNSSGQGRGVFRISKTNQVVYSITGYSFFGKEVEGIKSLEEIHRILQPFERLGRVDNYIIQEGVNTITPLGKPFKIRIHIQKVKEQWKVGGMFASIALEDHVHNGVINLNRGAKGITIEELLTKEMGLDDSKSTEMLNKLKNLATATSEVISGKYPCREYGIDVGINKSGRPMVFEVNTTPSIAAFHRLNKDIWQEIINVRKGKY